MKVLRAMRLVAVATCVLALVVTAASCGQELPDEGGSSAEGSKAAQKTEKPEEAQAWQHEVSRLQAEGGLSVGRYAVHNGTNLSCPKEQVDYEDW